MVGWECADQNENHEHDDDESDDHRCDHSDYGKHYDHGEKDGKDDDGESDDVLPKDIGSAWTRGSKFCCHLGSKIDSPSINTCQTNLWLQARPWFLVGVILELHESNQAD